VEMLTRLDPPIPINTPKGSALAHFIIDYGIEHNLCWVVFQDETGECWTWDNKDIRAQKNITIGRTMDKPFWETKNPKSKPKKLTPSKKASAKRMAKAAGRPYPNLVDNARAARKK